jgi:hypothetical protein
MSTKPNSNKLRTLVTVTGFAAVTAAATLAVCAPRTTFADGDDADRMGEYTDDGTKFDDIVVKGEIQKDVHSRSGWSVLVTAKNTADHPETLSLETDLDRSFVTPAARVGAEQAMLYSQTQPITVAANATVTFSRPVPAWVVPQLETGRRSDLARAAAQKKVDDGAEFQTYAQVLYAPYPTFGLQFFRGGAKPMGVAPGQPMVGGDAMGGGAVALGSPAVEDSPPAAQPPVPAPAQALAPAPAQAPAPALAPPPAPAPAPAQPGPVAAR